MILLLASTVLDSAQLTRWTAPLASALIALLWQGLILVSLLALGLAAAPRMAAAIRFRLWLAAFLLAALLPWLPAVVPTQPAPEPLRAALLSGAAHTQAAWLNLDGRWSLGIAALWAGLALLRLLNLVRQAWQARQLWALATPTDADLLPAAIALQLKLPLRRAARLCTTRALDRPCVVGLFSPRILLPASLLLQLGKDELGQVLLHELEHLRRFDDWTNLLQKFILALVPLSPALLLAERELCRQREMACDEAVVSRTRAPRAYAATLAAIAERGRELRLLRQAEALALGLFRRKHELVERVESLLQRPAELRPALRATLAAGLCLVLLLTSAGVSSLPQLVGFSAAQATSAATSIQTPARLQLAAGSVRSAGPQTAGLQTAGRRSKSAGQPAQPAATPQLEADSASPELAVADFLPSPALPTAQLASSTSRSPQAKAIPALAHMNPAGQTRAQSLAATAQTPAITGTTANQQLERLAVLLVYTAFEAAQPATPANVADYDEPAAMGQTSQPQLAQGQLSSAQVSSTQLSSVQLAQLRQFTLALLNQLNPEQINQLRVALRQAILSANPTAAAPAATTSAPPLPGLSGLDL